MIEFLLPGTNYSKDARTYIINNVDQYADKLVLLSSTPTINCIAASLLTPFANALFIRHEEVVGFICVASRSNRFKVGLTYNCEDGLWFVVSQY
jgi:hypothetical protein